MCAPRDMYNNIQGKKCPPTEKITVVYSYTEFYRAIKLKLQLHTTWITQNKQNVQ